VGGEKIGNRGLQGEKFASAMKPGEGGGKEDWFQGGGGAPDSRLDLFNEKGQDRDGDGGGKGEKFKGYLTTTNSLAPYELMRGER